MSNDLDLENPSQQKSASASQQTAKPAVRSVFDEEPEGMSGKKKIFLTLALLAAGGGVEIGRAHV